MSFLTELKDRKLVQWTLAYLAAAWVLLQVLQFVSQSFDWPPQIVRVSTILAIAGLAVVLIIAWNHGEQGRQGISVLEATSIGLVLLAGGGIAWLLRGAAEPSAAVATEKNSIAVLPFANMSAANDEYFSDGVTEEILNALAKTPGLRVAARTSSFSFKGKDVPVDEVGKRLHVANVLEGSVRKAGQQVRITAQLVNAANGYQLWSETYDRELQNIFAVQEEISRAIVEKLKLSLSGKSLAVNATTTDTTAHDLYLRGRYQFVKRTPESLRLAERLFSNAIKADPSFAPAHAGLAATLIVLPLYTDVNTQDVRARARAAATRAIELDSTLAEGWRSLGGLRMSYDHDWRSALVALERAERLNPSDATTQIWLGDWYAGQNRLTDALPHYSRTVVLDPMSAVNHFAFGWFNLFLHRPANAIPELERAIELDPTLSDSYVQLARAKIFLGNTNEGVPELEAAVVRSNRRALDVGYLGNIYATLGRTADAQKLLAELQVRRKTTYITPLADAFVYIGLHDFDRAFVALEQARKDGDQWLTENNPDPILDPIRSDPRWAALRRRMGIS